MKFFPKLFILIPFFILLGCGEVGKWHSNALKEASRGNYEGAIKIWNEILDIEKDNPLYLNNLGWTLFRNDNFEEAKATLEKAESKCESKNLRQSIESNLFMVLTFQDGKRLLQNGNYTEAIAEFEKVAFKYNTKELELKYFALCYEGLEKYDEAKEEWEKIIDMHQESNIRNKFYLLAKEKLSL